MIGDAIHRVGQFWRHSAGQVNRGEARRAAEILGPVLFALFSALPRNEQRHGLDVLATVDRQQAEPDRLLRQAALLHDMGKATSRLSVVDRSQAVFLRALSPRLLGAYLRVRPGFASRWHVYRDHATVGAQRLRAAGATELAVIVEEHHAQSPAHSLTRQLKIADARN